MIWGFLGKGPPGEDAFNPTTSGLRRVSHDAIGEVLEAIIEFGGDGPHAAIHHLFHQQLELLLSHAHVEPLFEVANGAGAMEARKLRTWGKAVTVNVVDN